MQIRLVAFAAATLIAFCFKQAFDPDACACVPLN
jgi:hypothetical protein